MVRKKGESGRKLTKDDIGTLEEMERYFTRCISNCIMGSQAYKLYSRYVLTLQKAMKAAEAKEEKHD